MTYNLALTIDQINEMVFCMKDGPYARVNALIQELQRQCAQQPSPPTVKSDTQGAGANGAGAIPGGGQP